MRKVIIDLDGTICQELPTFEKSLAKPKKGAKKFINSLFRKNFIIIYTARGWSEYKVTKKWLKTFKIKHHLLMCGKPIYDIWIDDRCIKFESWEDIRKNLIDKK